MNQGQFDMLHSWILKYAHLNMPQVEPHEVSEMFVIHNLEFPHEYSKSCGGCRERVWKNLQNFYHDHKTRFGY